jgi:hypothetical protein
VEFSKEFEDRIDKYLAKSKADREALKNNKSVANKSKGKEQLHEYSLEDYGLSAELVNTTFAEYITKYDL